MRLSFCPECMPVQSDCVPRGLQQLSYDVNLKQAKSGAVGIAQSRPCLHHTPSTAHIMLRCKDKTSWSLKNEDLFPVQLHCLANLQILLPAQFFSITTITGTVLWLDLVEMIGCECCMMTSCHVRTCMRFIPLIGSGNVLAHHTPCSQL